MICYSCENIKECSLFHDLHVNCAGNFVIKKCINYDEISATKYKHIAEHDDLMALIFDYFTGNLKGQYDYDYAKECIIKALRRL